MGSDSTSRTFARVDTGLINGVFKAFLSGTRQRTDKWKGDGGQDQRPAERRADANGLLRRRVSERDGHEGDHALRKRRAEGGQDSAGGLLAHGELAPEPFDAVHEILARQIDHDRRAEQQKNGDQEIGHEVSAQGETGA